MATKEFKCQVYVFRIRNLTIMAKYDAKNAQLMCTITMSQFKDEKTENLPNAELLKNWVSEKTGSSVPFSQQPPIHTHPFLEAVASILQSQPISTSFLILSSNLYLRFLPQVTSSLQVSRSNL
jgi:hypothetical protein